MRDYNSRPLGLSPLLENRILSPNHSFADPSLSYRSSALNTFKQTDFKKPSNSRFRCMNYSFILQTFSPFLYRSLGPEKSLIIMHMDNILLSFLRKKSTTVILFYRLLNEIILAVDFEHLRMNATGS